MAANAKSTLTIQARRTEFKEAIRIQQSLLAPIEKRFLIWLAHRTPPAINPDHLTILGFGAQIAAGILYAASGRWRACLLLVNFCIALNWLGDSLDGTLARVRNRQRPRYGFYVDHITDTFGAIAIMAGLARSGSISERGAAVMLIGFLLLSVNSYLATYTIGDF
ncbi:MAG: CDP-alcohol phosphatidyltransferase family protein, partial [Blastocatellia bacterium]